MIIEKRKLFFSSARIILDDAALRSAISSKKYSYVTGISHHRVDIPGVRVAVKRKKTICVNIHRPMEAIFADFTASARNEVRHTWSDPKFTVADDDKNYDAIYRLYMDFEQAQGRKPFDRSIFLGCKAFSAYYDGELVSGVICYDSPPYLRSRANFSKRLSVADGEFLRIVSRASKRVMYEICSYGAAHGYTFFDHGSVNVDDPGKAGIREFKSSFGGEMVDEYTYTCKSPLFRLVSKFMKFS